MCAWHSTRGRRGSRASRQPDEPPRGGRRPSHGSHRPIDRQGPSPDENDDINDVRRAIARYPFASRAPGERNVRCEPIPMPGKTTRYAISTIVMRGDAYVPGALGLGYSLRLVGTTYDTICMVTNDVTPEAQARLANLYTYVVEIPYLEFQVKRPIREREQKLYESWLYQSCTRWRCLQFTQYEKMCHMDCDIIVYQNIDHVFQTDTPAGVFIYSNPPYNVFGAKMPRESTNVRLKGHLTAWGGFTVLVPNCSDLDIMSELVHRREPYGWTHSTYGTDEVALCHTYYTKGEIWTQLGTTYFVNYNYIESSIKGAVFDPKARKVDINRSLRMEKVICPVVQHFMTLAKPWLSPRYEWPDLTIWWEVMSALAQDPTFSADVQKDFIHGLDRKNLGMSDICVLCNMADDRFKVLREKGLNFAIPIPDPASHTLITQVRGKFRITCPLIHPAFPAPSRAVHIE